MKTINQALNEQNNDYSHIEKEYLKLTGFSLSLDPISPPPQQLKAKSLTATVVIPAWNVSKTILSCLTAIEQSSFNLKHQHRLQVVVVDDGSTDGTWEIIKNASFSLRLTVIKQKHGGQSKALNTGISVAEGEIIVSCDADMILSYFAIEHFVSRHQVLSNLLLAGFRTDISGNDPKINPTYIRKHGGLTETCFIGDERIEYPTSGWPKNMCLVSRHYKDLGNARGLWMPDDEACQDPWRLSDLVFGALFSLPRSTYFKIGGYDERLQGWGCGDSLIAAKAIANKYYVIPVYAASGFHIKHSFRTGNRSLGYSRNRKKFFEIIKTEYVANYTNWIKNAKNRILQSLSKNPTQTTLNQKTENLPHRRTVSTDNEINDLLALGKHSEAYCSLIKKPPKKDNEKLMLGKALIGMRKYREATEFLLDVHETSYLYSEAAIEQTIAFAASGEFESARKTLNKLAQTFPKTSDLAYWLDRSSDIYILQGKKYFDQGFYDVAIRCFEAALITEPNNSIALKYRSQCKLAC